MMWRSFLALCLLCASHGFARHVSAEPAAAEALFREGRRLLDAGQYEEAAKKLAESQAQDPASGTLINLALAYEKQGKLATAWVTYRDAAAFARRDGRADRVASAERKAHEIEPRVPRVVLHSKAATDGRTIQLGEMTVGPGALGSPIPIDPGEYHLTAHAPGRQPWEMTVVIAEGQNPEISVPELSALPAARHPEMLRPSAAPEGGPPTWPTQLELRRVSSPSPQHRDERVGRPILPWVIGASGIASLGVGSIFGFRAFSRYSDAQQACPQHQGCDAKAMEAWRDSKTSAWIADVAFAAGLAACVTSAWWLLTRSNARENATLHFVPLQGGAALSLRTRL